jgi:hypothetical protein
MAQSVPQQTSCAWVVPVPRVAAFGLIKANTGDGDRRADRLFAAQSGTSGVQGCARIRAASIPVPE